MYCVEFCGVFSVYYRQAVVSPNWCVCVMMLRDPAALRLLELLRHHPYYIHKCLAPVSMSVCHSYTQHVGYQHSQARKLLLPVFSALVHASGRIAEH